MSDPKDNVKCLRCDKTIFEGQNTIGCDECLGWLHIRCAGIRVKDFKKICSDKNSSFICRYCTYYKCGKCCKPVYPVQNGIQCDLDDCQTWYHLRCTKFTLAEYLSKNSRLHTDEWFCPQCNSLPFMELNDKMFKETVKPDLDLKALFKNLTDTQTYQTRCSVCHKKITKNQQPKSFPCTSCKSFVHRKCCNISLPDLLETKASGIKNWSCNSCMTEYFPFQNTEAQDLLKLNFNSLVHCPCQRDSSEVSTAHINIFKSNTNLYDSDEIFTHAPDPHNNMDLSLDINVSCNYYTNHDFHKLAKNIDRKNAPFTALHTNIESLMHNFDSLERLGVDLDYPFDIIAVTETWNPSSGKDKFIPKFLENYNKYNGLSGTTLKSGCGLYIRTGLKYKDRKDLDIQHYDDINEYQCKFIEIINTKGSNIILCVCYRHPKKASDNSYNTWLDNTLDQICKEHKTLIFMGDFNYNLLKYSYTEQIKTFVDTMASRNLQPTINKPTRIVRNQQPSLIDNIFTNATDKEIITGNLVSKITDHMPNFIIMKHITFAKKSIRKRRRSFKNFNLEDYQKDIDSIDLTPAMHFDTNDLYKYYHDQLLNTINKHAPYISMSNEELKWTRKPWIGKRLQKIIKHKNKLYKKYINNHKSKFWYNRYRTVCDSVKLKIKEAKKSYFSWYFKTNMNNSKKIWKGINEIIHNKYKKDAEEIFLDDDGSIITDQKTVANRFNKFYTTIASKLVTKLGKPSTKYQDYLKNPNEHTIFLKETDFGEVSTLIHKLDITKSGDIYGITPKLIKDAGPGMASNLTILFNKSIATGIFPQLLKTTKVILIYKSDSRMLASNYRPISLLPIIGKLFEKILFNRFSSFIAKYKVLYHRQYGFQSGKATEHAVIDIQENILKSLENKESPCCIFLDFAKAFDTVNHEILLQKLNHYGIRGNALSLIESYLTDREQCVQLNNITSDMDFIRHGVPQGSILGPLFFLLYINDIAACSSILTFYLFADDTAIFFSHKNRKELERILNEELTHVSSWLIANKLSLNVGKSNLLLFRTRNDKTDFNLDIKINGLTIEEKQYAKYLGILIDNKLSFSKQTEHVKSRLVKGNAILSIVRHFLPKQVLINTYNAYIQPHIDYGLNVWGHTYQTHLNPIKRQQRKALRLINFKKKHDDTTELFSTDRLLPFDESLKLSSAKLMWKAAHNLLPSALKMHFQKRLFNNTFHLPFRRIEICQHSAAYQAVQVWNNISPELRHKKSLNSLKTNYKNKLLSSLASAK